jgi:tartrate-resistant acid phosphatase type 5
MRKFILLLLSSTYAEYVTVFGDWGRDTKGYKYVVKSLRSLAEARGKAIGSILLGDNFYSKGVTSVNDPNFELFLNFSDTSQRFFVIAGNHDHRGNVTAQIEYSQINPKWVFPSLYYSKKIDIPNSNYKLCLVFLDTELILYDNGVQAAWLDKELSDCHGERVIRVVSGHHPLYSVGMYARSKTMRAQRALIEPILIKHKIHLYLAGHEHQLQAFESNGIHHLISGAVARLYPGNTPTSDNGLKFQAVDYGYLVFGFSNGIVDYSFINAKSGDVMYKQQIHIPAGSPGDPRRRENETTTTKQAALIEQVFIYSMILLLGLLI